MTSIFNDFFNLDKDDRQPAEINYTNTCNPSNEQIKIKATVYGRVQGVGFRFTTKHLATSLGINGKVQNEEDGTVYIEASGSKENIDQFITEVAKGPSPRAAVDQVVVEYDHSLPEYNGFSDEY